MYGTIDGQQLFSSKELTLEPGAKCTLQDPGASGWITVQGRGRIGRLAIQTPVMIRFGADTEDEVFITHEAAQRGVDDRKHRQRTARGLALLRPGRASETSGNWRLSQKVNHGGHFAAVGRNQHLSLRERSRGIERVRDSRCPLRCPTNPSLLDSSLPLPKGEAITVVTC